MLLLSAGTRSEIASMLRIAVPLALAELGWMLMSAVDNIMVGRLPNSAEAIGAASIGSALFYGFTIFGLGLMSGLDALISQAFGADDWPEARKLLASGLALALCAAPVLVSCIFAAVPLLSLLRVEQSIARPAVEFTHTLVWSAPLLLIYSTFRRYLQGIHNVAPIAFALVTSNLVNLFGNWVLIFGNLGMPAMGVRGSALSTVVARVYLAAVLGFAVWRCDPAAFNQLRPDRARMKKLFRLGLPAALTIGFEVGVFNVVTALAGTLGAVNLAAHTIALNAAALTYMVPLGIGSAAAVSVGRELGRRNFPAARRAGWIALAIATAYECASMGLFLLLPRTIARIYTQDPQVIEYCASLFVIAALFQLFDGVQTVGTGALRGAGNTRTPMLWNLVGYWAIGLPLGCWLCYRLNWGAVGLWTGLCASLVLIGLGLLDTWRSQTFSKHIT